MTLFNFHYHPFFKPFLVLLVIGQLAFALFSSGYTAPRHEGRIFATIGVKLGEQVDLSKLNEAAHYFGQTIIGWTKFPHFLEQMKAKATLPADVGFSAHMQERQNIVFTFTSVEPLTQDHLNGARDYLQSKLTEYNRSSSTGFTLSNVDYEILETTRSYASGALLTLIVSAGLVLVWIYGKFLL
ncbi:MAG: hypothetical protein V1908_02230 [Candidatus Peregrinibacteria bacterium]